MDKVAILDMLPTEAPAHLYAHCHNEFLSELGGHLAIYKRVSYSEAPQLKEIMCPNDWDDYYKPRKGRWLAECTCTACGESWHTVWLGGPLKQIAVIVGEDGISYPVEQVDDPDAAPFLTALSHNDGTSCPICGENVTLVHSSRIKSGSTRRIALCSIDNIGQYTALLYWLSRRHIDSDGAIYEEITPWYAYLIDETGRLIGYRHSYAGWHLSSERGDPFYKKYVSGDGDIYNFRRGGFVLSYVPDLGGCSGEKTGLGEYVRQGGQHPMLYIKTWRKKPALENLINAGWAPLIESLFVEATHDYEFEISEAALLDINWTSRKPHEMLGIDRVSFRNLAKSDGRRRLKEWYRAWRTYQSVGGRLNACEFDQYWCSFTSYGIDVVIELMAMLPGLDIPRIDRYLKKQGLRPTEVRILADTWRMTGVLYGRANLTHEEMWPKYLIEKHDQLTAMNLAEKGKESWLLYLAGFRRIIEKYGELQWTDGDLCIILPKDNGELVREGSTLRHCVGTYGQPHVTEEQTIFFVRHYRRPERCYYTLAVNMRGIPKRVQLHGYGNERHGRNKEYRHKIPQKVLDFCDRWEREVLMPWYRNKQKQAQLDQKGSKTA